MKTKLTLKFAAALLLLSTLASQLSTAYAQTPVGTAFTYQGRLNNGANPANGLYDFEFSLSNAPSGGSQVGSTVPKTAIGVTNGLFTTTIDFGPVFTGNDTWLAISVRSNNVGSYIGLSPLQELTPTPYAIYAESAGSVPGLVVQPNSDGAPNLIGGSPVNFVTSGVVGATIGGGGATSFFGVPYTNSVSYDFGTVSGGAGNTAGYLATVGGGLFNTASGNYSAIGGGYNNTANGIGSFIGGGGSDGYTFDGNQIETNAATICGGLGNTISSGGLYGFIGGGWDNTASAFFATVGGGDHNTASGAGSFVGGGGWNGADNFGNSAAGVAATIGGGFNNNIQVGGRFAFIGGGVFNTASNLAATVCGGLLNNAGGQGSFIGGGGYDGTTQAGNQVQANAATIGGGLGNNILSNATYAVIAGGLGNTNSGEHATISGGQQNAATNNYATVGGGVVNTAGGAAGTVGGGQGNNASASYAIVGGGINNIASGQASFIGGGGFDGSYVGNLAQGIGSAISGGVGNNILSGGNDAFIGAGRYNTNSGEYAMIPGGEYNVTGDYSFAAGYAAKAVNPGTFVWSDGSAPTASTVPDQFIVRASGGAIIYSSSGSVDGVSLAANATAWTTISDRNAKKNFKPVDSVAVLDKLAAIPIQQWNYKWEKDTDVPNIGPMAQDFKHAFYPGRDDKGITTLEFDGVELAAIQGLNQKLNEKDATIQEQGAEIQDLKQSMAQLKQMIFQLAQSKTK